MRRLRVEPLTGKSERAKMGDWKMRKGPHPESYKIYDAYGRVAGLVWLSEIIEGVKYYAWTGWRGAGIKSRVEAAYQVLAGAARSTGPLSLDYKERGRKLMHVTIPVGEILEETTTHVRARLDILGHKDLYIIEKNRYPILIEALRGNPGEYPYMIFGQAEQARQEHNRRVIERNKIQETERTRKEIASKVLHYEGQITWTSMGDGDDEYIIKYDINTPLAKLGVREAGTNRRFESMQNLLEEFQGYEAQVTIKILPRPVPQELPNPPAKTYSV